jgi:hypothetical protein
MTNQDVCPHCRYYCDWEDDDNETIAHQATLVQDEIRYESSKILSHLQYNLNRDKMAVTESSKYKPDDYDRPE